jgi:hypothetical protein
MRRLGRWIWITLAILLCATAAAAALPHFAVELYAPHTARRSRATLEDGLKRAVDAGLLSASPATATEALDYSLSVTDKLLYFGLSHPTRLSFVAAAREANCIEYAELFAHVFDRAAQKARLKARAYVIHSDKARVFGQTLPFRGWEDHDWVLIEDRTGPGDVRRLYVDPSLHDAGLGWDISSNVKGEIRLPQ